VFDQSGALNNVRRHDYLPFGEELFAPVDGRTAVQGYASGDGVRQHFTAKERDNETGLDYFGARYYASTQGRFTSVDPLLASAKRRNPQTWNRYTYGMNNPLRFTDPDGEEAVDENPDLKARRTTTTTEVIVQDADRRGNIVQQAKVTVTETKTEFLNADGQVDASVDPITVTTARAENTGNGALAYSQDQLGTMANVAQSVVAVSREKLFDPTIALGIANTETRLGSAPPGETAAHKQPNINPMQLSATSGTTATTDLRSNIAGSINVFNRSSASTNTLNQRLQDYNGESTKVAYANKAERQINQIRQSVKTNTTLIRLSIF
jgi:RHS repeat-associated protein